MRMQGTRVNDTSTTSKKKKKNVFLVYSKLKWTNWKPYKSLPKQLCKLNWLKQSFTNALSSVFSKGSAALLQEIRRKENKPFLRLSDCMVIGRFSRMNNGQWSSLAKPNSFCEQTQPLSQPVISFLPWKKKASKITPSCIAATEIGMASTTHKNSDT